MNWYKNHTVYEFVLYNLYNNCMNSCVWIRTKISEKNCFQVGISTRDQYRACNRRRVCHPPLHLLRQWPFYLYSTRRIEKTIRKLRLYNFIRVIYSHPLPTMKRAVPYSWCTSNGTFQTKKVGVIDISFMEYSASKSVKLTPDIVEYKVGAQPPLYDLIRQENLAQYRCGPGL